MKQQAGKWGKVAPVGTARRVAWVGDELALVSPVDQVGVTLACSEPFATTSVAHGQ